METFKKYLPWIIVAAVGLYLLSRLSGQSTRLVPQTQFTETPQLDPLAESRAGAFSGLLQLAGLQIGEEAETARAEIVGRVTTRAQDIQRELGLKALETDLGKADLFAQAQRLAAEYQFFSRENDRQIQQSAIDRYQSSRTQSDIIGSINTALGIIFGNRSGGGNVFGTPTTFPRSGSSFSGGGFGGGFGF